MAVEVKVGFGVGSAVADEPNENGNFSVELRSEETEKGLLSFFFLRNSDSCLSFSLSASDVSISISLFLFSDDVYRAASSC